MLLRALHIHVAFFIIFHMFHDCFIIFYFLALIPIQNAFALFGSEENLKGLGSVMIRSKLCEAPRATISQQQSLVKAIGKNMKLVNLTCCLSAMQYHLTSITSIN